MGARSSVQVEACLRRRHEDLKHSQETCKKLDATLKDLERALWKEKAMQLNIQRKIHSETFREMVGTVTVPGLAIFLCREWVKYGPDVKRGLDERLQAYWARKELKGIRVGAIRIGI